MDQTYSDSAYLLYDGDCPFCSAYVRMQRLREAGMRMRLLDAREHPSLVAAHARAGRDVNEGMILMIGDTVDFGGDVLFKLSLMSGTSGGLNRMFAKIFSNRSLARGLYPVLRGGRNVSLRVLGRRKIAIEAG